MYTQFKVFFWCFWRFFDEVSTPGQGGFFYQAKMATRAPSRFSELLAARVAIM